ncbi:MAG: hypothetical protein ACRCX2_22230 [Paraclostridium sp.]
MISINYIDLYVLLFRAILVSITLFSHRYISTLYSDYMHEEYGKSHLITSIIGYNFNIVAVLMMYIFFDLQCNPGFYSNTYCIEIIYTAFLKTMLLETFLILIFNVVGASPEDSCMNKLIRKLHFPAAVHNQYIEDSINEDENKYEKEQEDEDDYQEIESCECKSLKINSCKCTIDCNSCCCNDSTTLSLSSLIVKDNDDKDENKGSVECLPTKRKRRTKAEMMEYRNSVDSKK